MVSAVSSTTETQPVAQSTGTSTQKKTQAEPPAATGTDSVQLSKIALARVAAVQEATETSAQTAQEASHGDLQAQRLVARQAAEKPDAK
jgi:hypothetical protein